MKNCGLEGVDSLPRCGPSKRLRYEKQIKALHLFCLLLLAWRRDFQKWRVQEEAWMDRGI